MPAPNELMQFVDLVSWNELEQFLPVNAMFLFAIDGLNWLEAYSCHFYYQNHFDSVISQLYEK